MLQVESLVLEKIRIKIMFTNSKYSSLFLDITIDLNSKSSQKQHQVCSWSDFSSSHSRETSEGKYRQYGFC